MSATKAIATAAVAAALLPGTRVIAESGLGVSHPNIQVLSAAIQGPEGPTVLADGSVVLAEFFSGDILKIGPDGRRAAIAHVGVGVAGTARGRRGPLYVARVNYDLVRPDAATTPKSGSRGEIVSVDLNNGHVSSLYTEYQGNALMGPDDLVVDVHEDLWWTDVLEQAVYWGREDGSEIRRMVSGVAGVNGITLSPDRSLIYVISGRRLVSYRIVGRGLLEMNGMQPRVHVLTPLSSSLQKLDGLKTQANGDIVMADWVEGLTVMSPDGRVVSHTRLPGDLQSVNMAFGGRGHRTLFIATASGDSSGWKSDGKLVAIPWPNPGL